MYKRGAVVLVPFPFTDLSGSKVRPAVIVSDGKVGQDVVVVFVTSQTKSRAKHTVSIRPTKENGIKTNSKIICSKIATLEAKVVLGEIGELSATEQKKVTTELHLVLGL